MDRQNAISAIKTNLGYRSTVGIERYVIRVSLRATLKASFDIEGMIFTETGKVERDIPKYSSISDVMISEMESEVVNIVAKKLIDTISEYVNKRSL